MEVLLSYNIELRDALLHAINEESVEAVEVILKHQQRKSFEDSMLEEVRTVINNNKQIILALWHYNPPFP